METSLTLYRKMFTYDDVLCRLRWHPAIKLYDSASKSVPNSVAGCISTDHGYVIKLSGTNRSGARLIWVYHSGESVRAVSTVSPDDIEPCIDRLYVVPKGSNVSKFRAKCKHVVMWCRVREQYAVTYVKSDYSISRISYHNDMHQAEVAALDGWGSLSFL